MKLYQCPTCGFSGWSFYEIKNNQCPACKESDAFYCCKCHAMYKEECVCDMEEDEELDDGIYIER
jgi:hypothetical protein